VGKRHVERLQWYVLAPGTGAAVLLAEAIGELNLSAADSPAMELRFAQTDAKLRYKTRGLPTDHLQKARVSTATRAQGRHATGPTSLCAQTQQWIPARIWKRCARADRSTLFKQARDTCSP